MLKTSRMDRSAGFTLVEMMIAVVIVAIMLAIGVPSFRTFIHNAQIRTAAESMQAGLQLARSEALRRNARVTLWLVNDLSAACVRTNAGNSWVVSMENPTAKCNVAASETVSPRAIQSRAGSDGSINVSVAALNSADPPAGASCITFNGFGRVEDTCVGGDDPVVTLTFASASSPEDTKTLQIRVDRGGSSHMCDPTVSVASDPAYCGV
jgi:type IV fimbrial biogenesis protein FimT